MKHLALLIGSHKLRDRCFQNKEVTQWYDLMLDFVIDILKHFWCLRECLDKALFIIYADWWKTDLHELFFGATINIINLTEAILEYEA